MAKKEKKTKLEIEPTWCVIFYDICGRRNIEFHGNYEPADKRTRDVNGYMCPDYKLQHCIEEFFPPVFVDV